jgi:hypothetical protein
MMRGVMGLHNSCSALIGVHEMHHTYHGASKHTCRSNWEKYMPMPP